MKAFHLKAGPPNVRDGWMGWFSNYALRPLGMRLDPLLAAPRYAHGMEDVVTIIQHGIGRHLSPVGAVVLAAVVLAWLDHAARLRRMRPYDAWWLFNLPTGKR